MPVAEQNFSAKYNAEIDALKIAAKIIITDISCAGDFTETKP